MKEKTWGLSSSSLKLIAVISMLIDHMGFVLFPQYPLMRAIGRLAFPIYCFLITEGAAHTSNWKRYALRLFLFALISEIPFDLAMGGRWIDGSYQNVFWTLLLGLLAIELYEKKTYLAYAGIVVLVLAGNLLGTDYGSEGVLLIWLLHVVRKDDIRWAAVVAAVWCLCFGGVQQWGMISALFLLLYNGKRGWSGLAIKYAFYAFYPIHLLVLYAAALLRIG